MTTTDFSEIERLHSEWSRLNKVAKLAYLKGNGKTNPNAYEYGLYLKSRTSITLSERLSAHYLIYDSYYG